MTARFIPADYPGGRILLRSGAVDVGAVFPPSGKGQHRNPWVWRFWGWPGTTTRDGSAKTELAAKPPCWPSGQLPAHGGACRDNPTDIRGGMMGSFIDFIKYPILAGVGALLGLFIGAPVLALLGLIWPVLWGAWLLAPVAAGAVIGLILAGFAR
jgi:hypothetical protein